MSAVVKATLRVSTRSGETLTYDLLVEEGREAWARDRAQASFQSAISSVSLDAGVGAHTLSAPSGFRMLSFDAFLASKEGAVVAACISCHADDVRTVLTQHLGNGVVRASIDKSGRMRWTPDGGPAMGAAPARRTK